MDDWAGGDRCQGGIETMTHPRYREGYAAFKSGLGFLDNPYLEIDITAARVWIDGYVQSLIDARTVGP